VGTSWKDSLTDHTEFRSRGAMLDERENALVSAIYSDEQSSPADPVRIKSFCLPNSASSGGIPGVAADPAARAQITFCARKRAISSTLKSASRRTSALCSPAAGGRRRASKGRSLILKGGANCLTPSTSTIMPRASSCSFSRLSSKRRTGVTQQSTRSNSAVHSAKVRCAKVASSSRRMRWPSAPVAKAKGFRSGRSIAAHSICQNFGSMALTAK
jgi:hypothetical protein